jgi:hypothetical protein
MNVLALVQTYISRYEIYYPGMKPSASANILQKISARFISGRKNWCRAFFQHWVPYAKNGQKEKSVERKSRIEKDTETE